MKHKKKLILVLAAAVVCVLFQCCTGDRQYDTRLVTADSLLTIAADSALWQLEHINSQSLSTAGDRAYHALLLSQARYKCYVPATSDSTIDVALRYYQRHRSERDKLTRANVYKGAILEELEQIDSAMTYYKKALDIASPQDIFHQGYIRLRIGRIYRDHLVADSSDIIYFKEALRYFRQIPDSGYILTCLNNIGTTYYKINHDSVQPYLSEALSLAHRLGDRARERRVSIDMAKTIMFSGHDQDIEKAKTIVLPMLDNRSGCSLEDLSDLLLTATYTLAKQNKTDSALLFLNQLPDKLPNSNYESFKLLCKAEISRSRGDIDQFALDAEAYRHFKERIIKDEKQHELRNAEARYDNEKLKFDNERYKWLLSSWLMVTLLVLSVLVIALMHMRHKSTLRKHEIEDLEATIEQLQRETAALPAQLEQKKAMSEQLKKALKSQIETITQLVMNYNETIEENPKAFRAAFKEIIGVQQPDTSFWNGIEAYANLTHRNLIATTANKFPSLTPSDIHFLSLSCCELPPTVVMTLMGYNEIHSYYNKKRRLTNALKLTGKLEDFILMHQIPESELNGHLPPED